MKIVYNTWFPFGSYHTLNFFGILNRYLGKFNGQGVGRSRQTNAT